MNQFGGFGYGNPGSGLSTVSQSSGQSVTLQMPPMPPQVVCAMSNLPVNVQCPLCQSQMATSVERQVGLRAKLMAFALIIAGCCCILPCIWNNLKDTVHYCGNCQAELGRYMGQSTGIRRRQ